MKLYRLNIYPDQSEGEGGDYDEWFGSLEAARKRRAQLIRDEQADYRMGPDLGIDAVEMPPLSIKRLALHLLNREHLQSSEAVPAHDGKLRTEEPEWHDND